MKMRLEDKTVKVKLVEFQPNKLDLPESPSVMVSLSASHSEGPGFKYLRQLFEIKKKEFVCAT